MNREIETIVNVHSFAVLDASGQWSYNGSYMTCPDEIIIRQVTYSGKGAAQLCVIKSNIGTIGSVVTDSSFQSNPNARMQMRDPLSGPITFALFVPLVNAGSVQPATVTAGDAISVHMDFIRYRR